MKTKNDSDNEEWKSGSVKLDIDENTIRIVSEDVSARIGPTTRQPKEIGRNISQPQTKTNERWLNTRRE